MWFTEDAWAPIIILIMIGMGLAFAANSQQKPRLYVAAGFMVILCGLTYFIENIVVTEAEKIEKSIHDLAEAFHENDRGSTLNYFSPQDLELQNLANTALDKVDIQDDYRITDLQIQTSADNTLAQSHFRVNVTATVMGFSGEFRQPTRWILKWRKESDKWRITEVERLEPLGGNKMQPLQTPQ